MTEGESMTGYSDAERIALAANWTDDAYFSDANAGGGRPTFSPLCRPLDRRYDPGSGGGQSFAIAKCLSRWAVPASSSVKTASSCFNFLSRRTTFAVATNLSVLRRKKSSIRQQCKRCKAPRRLRPLILLQECRSIPRGPRTRASIWRRCKSRPSDSPQPREPGALNVISTISLGLPF